MRKISLFIVFISLIFSNLIWGQGAMAPKTGSVIGGKVVDANDNSPIEFATIALFRSTDSTLVGIESSKTDGSFILSNITPGRYRLKISFVGYKSLRIDSVIIDGHKPVFLNEIKLQPISAEIGEVVVKGERPMIENKIDRKVFYVDKNVIAQSGNATDVLQQVPSVQVDAQGTVSLRGSENVNILINGKPTTIDKTVLLQQIPASTIEKIEVITNPSAKYDPEGTGGIINIVLKDGAGTGTNASISVNASNNDKYNASVNLSYNPGRLTINASYGYRDDKRSTSGWTKRNYFYDNSIHNTESNGWRRNQSHMARLGFDYNFSQTFSAGINGSYNTGKTSDNETVNYTDIVNNLSTLWYRTSDESESNSRSELAGYFLKKFDKNGHEWRTDFTYNNENETEKNLYLNAFATIDSIFGNEKEDNPSKNHRYTVQSDYTWPFAEKMKLEAGFKGMFLRSENDRKGWFYDFNTNTYIVDPNRTSVFFYDEDNYAAYSTYSYSGDKLGVMVGLRFEYFTNRFHILNDKEYTNTFPALFPTMHTSYKLNDNNEITLSYTRRVNRPRGGMINPFADYSDPQNMRVGNPNIKPEYINSYELGYTYKPNKFTIQPTVFYRTTENMFTRLAIVDTVNAINIITFQNSKQSSAFGAELSVTYQPVKFWFINAGISAYQMELNATNLNNTTRSNFGYNGKIMSNTFLPGGFALQISAFYRSPFITPQGTSDPFYAFNMGIRKDFLRGKLTGTFTFNDIFNTMHFGMKMSSNQQTGQMYRQFDSQFISVGLTYKIGKQQPQQRKKQDNNNGNDNQMDDSMMY